MCLFPNPQSLSSNAPGRASPAEPRGPLAPGYLPSPRIKHAGAEPRPLNVARHSPQHGFTLVELLVVITIIGILIALLLPAVQAAREAGRKLQCSNHLKQIGLACLGHEAAQKFLPTGGWKFTFAGEPTRGYDAKRQPGGWLYNILPFLDLQSLHDLGIDEGPPCSYMPVHFRPGITTCIQTPVATYICPTRRRPSALPLLLNKHHFGNPYTDDVCPMATMAGRTDYAASGGDSYFSEVYNICCPTTVAVGDGCTAESWANTDNFKGTYTTGVVYARSTVKMADIVDGTSNTYLAGEKFLNPDHYTDGDGLGDWCGWNSGWGCDTVRWCGVLYEPRSLPSEWYSDPKNVPSQDVRCANAYDKDSMEPEIPFYAFGSAHAGGFNMVLCDGSVRSMSYSIDKETHHRLGAIADGQPVDVKAF